MTDKALVIGLYVNGYAIIRQLSQDPDISIVGLDSNKDNPGLVSKYLSEKYVIDYDDEKLVDFLINYGQEQDGKVVLYPTHDFHTRVFAENFDKLEKYYYIPVNPVSLPNVLSKKYQYEVCEKIGIPYPKSFFIESTSDLLDLESNSNSLLYPLIVKPYSKAENDRVGAIFRLKEIANSTELKNCISFMRHHIDIGFLVSEVVVGEPDNIWSYTAYCDQNSDILAGWTGRKLTQKPYYYGVFSTARYEQNPIVEKQGRLLLEYMDHVGIGQPEFKYDSRDDKYKLIEINPRYMMWNLLGWKGGINLPLIHFYNVTEQENKLKNLNIIQGSENAHLVFLPHELYNLVHNRLKIKFFKNILKALFLKNKVWAVWNRSDPLPSIKLAWILFKKGIKSIQ